jgi:hypothetical protein
MTAPHPKDLIRYDLLVHDALLGVVRKVLATWATQGIDGLPGGHGFLLSFATRHPGVRIEPPGVLLAQHPDEMTVALTRDGPWDDLQLFEDTDGPPPQHSVAVTAYFSGIPTRLTIPFEALTGFLDPCVKFGLRFERHQPAVPPGDNDNVVPFVARWPA